MARLEMEGNQINLDNLEKGIDNSAFSSLVNLPILSLLGCRSCLGAPANDVFQGEEELCEERDGPHGGNERKRREGNGRVASYCRKALQPASKAKRFCKAHAKALRRVCWGLLGAAYLCYFIAACWLNFQQALALVVITAVVIFFMCWSLFKKYCGAKVLTLLSPLWKCLQKSWPWLKWLLYVLLLGGLVTWLALDTAKKPEQLISLAGFCVLVLFLFAFSKHHSAVSWRAVFWGLGLEFLIGLFILRTTPGIQAFQWLGDQIQVFLGYTKAGSSFVFGNTLIEDVFAFQSLPIIIFFSCVMSILYYLGVMQWLILKISWLLQISLGTTPTETLSVAGNIFVGQTEAPLLIRPYLADMTHSEIHAVMAGGFSTIAGSVMGAYISFGIDAALLIAASVMAAPCALAMSKLVYPEVEESKFKGKESVRISSGEERNILEAASNGAAASIGLVANIAANLIAFLAVLEFINAALRWFGEMVEIKDLSFQERAESITTFALCGFANLSSIGIMLGGLTSMVPHRKSELASIVLRALLTGICVSMLNSCLAGLLYVPTEVGNCVTILINANFTSTNYTIYTCCKQLFASTVLENGTLSFTGAWDSVADSLPCLTGCCRHYNHTHCTA
ncbi:sodium/nucleoside cotransporter 2-like isoform X3 [Lagopus leucura]|uniref:sodium/nucleoside cotransporter 2-like isoform X3 n=1 Tax=Lagopus leucura TaxID=30410 RepID=UPI001C66282D|nr:sodium/nucleoside cotransporter 2-like isoform X3 [Lagopus leucura]